MLQKLPSRNRIVCFFWKFWDPHKWSHLSTFWASFRAFSKYQDTLQHTLQHTATFLVWSVSGFMSTLQHAATRCNKLQHTATHCNALQHTATRCNTLQHTANTQNGPICRHLGPFQNNKMNPSECVCVCVCVCLCLSDLQS